MTPDIPALITELRDVDISTITLRPWPVVYLCENAADALEAMLGRINTLKAGLGPFSLVAGNYIHQPDSMPITFELGARRNNCFDITVGDLRRANALIQEGGK